MATAADHARRKIADALYEVMLLQTGPTRASFILHQLPKGTGFSPAAAREALDTDPRFTESDGRYDIAIRMDVASRSFNTGFELLANDHGGCLPEGSVASFFGGLTHRDAAYYEQLIDSLVGRGDVLVRARGMVAPASWLLFPEGDSEDDVLFFCDLDGDPEIELLRPLLADESLRRETPLETAVGMVNALGDAVGNRALGFFVYRLHPEGFDAVALLEAMMADERVYPISGLRWVPGEVREQVREELRAISRVAEGKAPAPAALKVDLQTLLNEPLPSDHPGYYIEDNDLTMIYEVVHSSPEPVSIERLLFEVLELYPDDENYVPAAHSIYGLLHDDPSIMDAEMGSFLGRAGLPEWVSEIPQLLVPVVSDAPEDAVLEAEGLDNGLAEKLRDPFLEDYMDDSVSVPAGALTTDETFYTLPQHHLLAGTMKLRKMDRNFFGIPDAAAPIRAFDPEGNEHQVWVNADTGLVVGLSGVYETLGAQAGSLVSITHGEDRSDFLFDLAGTDDSTLLDDPRLADLLAARKGASGWTLFKAVCEVMAAYPEGVPFEAICAQVNVIRRATRIQIASVLTYHLCFRPSDGTGDQWIFAPRAVNAGTVQTKNRYIIKDWGAAK